MNSKSRREISAALTRTREIFVIFAARWSLQISIARVGKYSDDVELTSKSRWHENEIGAHRCPGERSARVLYNAHCRQRTPPNAPFLTRSVEAVTRGGPFGTLRPSRRAPNYFRAVLGLCKGFSFLQNFSQSTRSERIREIRWRQSAAAYRERRVEWERPGCSIRYAYKVVRNSVAGIALAPKKP